MDLIEISDNQNRHPWEISRMKNVTNICLERMVNYEKINICDIGAGDRYFDSELLIKLKDKGIKPYIHAIDSEYTNFHSDSDEIFLSNSIDNLKENSMDFIIMMDVLEHIQDDRAFIIKVLNLLKVNGTLLITVPAYSSLFSSHDRFLRHYRRYEYNSLRKLLENKNMNINSCHYFYFILFIVRWLQIKVKKYRPLSMDVGVGKWKYSSNNIRTSFVEHLLNMDFYIIAKLNRFHIRIPGLSLICVARKTLD